MGTNSGLLSSAVGGSALESALQSTCECVKRGRTSENECIECPSTFFWHWFLHPNKNNCSRSSLNFILVFIFNYVYGCVGLCTRIQVSRRPEVGVGCPEAGLQAVVCGCGMWKLNSNPLQEQYTILTTDL